MNEQDVEHNQHDLNSDDIARIKQAYEQLRAELAKVIVGQERVVEEMLIALLAGGHCLLVGVPGLAKTLMVRSVAQALGMSFNRIQFTPDLMPADITGTEVIQEDKATGERQLKFIPGPVFANIVLADEINRTPPKTQAALLEAMQEQQVTTGGKKHRLPEPFFVLATQNPIEQEGTYPLPEAQLDRFMFEILVDYPTEEEELVIVRQTTGQHTADISPVLNEADICRLQQLIRQVPVADHVIRFAMQYARLTRVDVKRAGAVKPIPHAQNGGIPDFVQDYVSWGAGPRASQFLILAAKARTILQGRTYVKTEDVVQVALPILRHRIITNFNAESEGITTEHIVQQLSDMIVQTSNERAGSEIHSNLFQT